MIARAGGVLLLASCAAGACGCATSQHGRLSRDDGVPIASLHVHNASERSSRVHLLQFVNGSVCNGRLSRTGASEGDDIDGPESEEGVAVVACGRGLVLRCQLTHRGGMGFVSGRCVDQSGRSYAVLF